jgi:hypothetical protein
MRRVFQKRALCGLFSILFIDAPEQMNVTGHNYKNKDINLTPFT